MRRRRDATGRAPPHDLCAGSAAHGSPQSRRRGRSPPRHRSGTTTLMRSAVSTMAGKRSAQSWPLRVKQRTRGAGRSGVTLPYPICWASISIWSKSSPWLLHRSRSLRYESPDHFLSLPKRTSDRFLSFPAHANRATSCCILLYCLPRPWVAALPPIPNYSRNRRCARFHHAASIGPIDRQPAMVMCHRGHND